MKILNLCLKFSLQTILKAFLQKKHRLCHFEPFAKRRIIQKIHAFSRIFAKNKTCLFFGLWRFEFTLITSILNTHKSPSISPCAISASKTPLCLKTMVPFLSVMMVKGTPKVFCKALSRMRLPQPTAMS